MSSPAPELICTIHTVSFLLSPFRTFTHPWDVHCFWFELGEGLIYPFLFSQRKTSESLLKTELYWYKSFALSFIHIFIYHWLDETWQNLSTTIHNSRIVHNNPYPPPTTKESFSVCLFVAQGIACSLESQGKKNKNNVCTQSENAVFKVFKFKFYLVFYKLCNDE